jgi:hypothetical protein
VIPGWRKVHNEELQNLCSSTDVIRLLRSERMRLAGHVAHMGDDKCILNFSRKPEWSGQLGMTTKMRG